MNNSEQSDYTKKEIDCENIIIDWLTRNGFKVYANRKSSKGLHTDLKFTVSNLHNRKPDLVVESPFLGFGAIEVKKGIDKRTIRDGSKVIDYFIDYASGDSKYFIDNVEIKINYFVLASEESINGKLIHSEQAFEMQDYPRHPKKEYADTKNIARYLWTEFRRKKQRQEVPVGSPKLGVLLSSCLNGDVNNKPCIFTISYVKDNTTNKNISWLDFEVIR